VLGIFKIALVNYLPRLASNLDPPDPCLLSSLDYRREQPAPGCSEFLNKHFLNAEITIYRKLHICKHRNFVKKLHSAMV
jgi:hypothetical protein